MIAAQKYTIPYQPVKNNYLATTAPGVTNDVSEGYDKKSHWYDTVTGNVYELVDKTEGAAVWKQTAGATFALTNGNGTTANGTAVDLGGNISSDVIFTLAGATTIKYAADYSANFVDESLINKGFADDTYHPLISGLTASASELNLLDLSGLTAGWVLSADSATTASWKAAAASYTVANESNDRLITSSGSGTGNAEANLTFDGSTLAVTGAISATQITGNIGFNTSDVESWASGYESIEGKSSSISFADSLKGIYISSNAFISTGWKYKSTGTAAQYLQFQGQHRFHVAPSGTADTNAFWTKVLHLQNDGTVEISSNDLYFTSGTITIPSSPSTTSTGNLKYSGGSLQVYDGGWNAIGGSTTLAALTDVDTLTTDGIGYWDGTDFKTDGPSWDAATFTVTGDIDTTGQVDITRTSGIGLVIDTSGSSSMASFKVAGSTYGELRGVSNNLYLNTNSGVSLQLKTNGTTAITIDDATQDSNFNSNDVTNIRNLLVGSNIYTNLGSNNGFLSVGNNVTMNATNGSYLLNVGTYNEFGTTSFNAIIGNGSSITTSDTEGYSFIASSKDVDVTGSGRHQTILGSSSSALISSADDYNAIIGGQAVTISSGEHVIALGLTSETLTSTYSDHTVVANLAVLTAPGAAGSTDKFLRIDGTTGIVTSSALTVAVDEIEGRDTATYTTNNGTTATAYTLTLDDETVYRVEAKIIARDAVVGVSADRAYYHIAGLFYRESAGSATQEGATASLIAIETSGTMNAAFSVSGNDVQIDVTGLAAQFIHWDIEIIYKEVV